MTLWFTRPTPYSARRYFFLGGGGRGRGGFLGGGDRVLFAAALFFLGAAGVFAGLALGFAALALGAGDLDSFAAGFHLFGRQAAGQLDFAGRRGRGDGRRRLGLRSTPV